MLSVFVQCFFVHFFAIKETNQRKCPLQAAYFLRLLAAKGRVLLRFILLPQDAQAQLNKGEAACYRKCGFSRAKLLRVMIHG